VTLIASARAVGPAGTVAVAVAAVAVASPGTSRGALEVLHLEVDIAVGISAPRIIVDTAIDAVDGLISVPAVRALGVAAARDPALVSVCAEEKLRERVVETDTTTEGDIIVVAARGSHGVVEAPGVLDGAGEGVDSATGQAVVGAVGAVALDTESNGSEESNKEEGPHVQKKK